MENALAEVDVTPEVEPLDAVALIEGIKSRVITEGPLAGETITLLEWEIQFAHGFCTHIESAITMGRGNGKTTFIAAIGCEFLDGSLTVPRGVCLVVASSMEQGRVCFNHIRYFMGLEDGGERRNDRMKDSTKRRWRVIDSQNKLMIQDLTNGVMLRVVGSDAKRAHGQAPSLVIADEPAQWERGGQKLWNALSTSDGKQANGRRVVLGTLPEDPQHFFCQMIRDPNVFSIVYQADKNDDEFSPATWRKANPSYDLLPALRLVIDREARSAKERGGNTLGAFRALRLNMGTPEITGRDPIVSIEDWRAITKPHTEVKRKGVLAVGIDLGAGDCMSSFSAYWLETGWLETWAAWPASPSLESRGKEDGVGQMYKNMQERGELIIYPGKATNNAQFIKDMIAIVEQYELIGVAADTYKKLDLEQGKVLAKVDWDIEYRRVGMGMDGSYDVGAFQNDVLEGWMRVGDNLLLQHAISCSVIRKDPNGNKALNRNVGYIDALQSGILAVGLGRRWRLPDSEESEGTIDDFIVRYKSESKAA